MTSPRRCGRIRSSKELMETFLRAGGRRGKAAGSLSIDLRRVGRRRRSSTSWTRPNMEAVVRDFGDRNPREDPVIHFYEDFLAAYDKKQKVSRGVFYTPRPVVSYIVGSVDELLRTGVRPYQDGLADTTTWGEMTERHKELEIPGRRTLPGPILRPDPRSRHGHWHVPRRGRST